MTSPEPEASGYAYVENHLDQPRAASIDLRPQLCSLGSSTFKEAQNMDEIVEDVRRILRREPRDLTIGRDFLIF